MKKVCLFGGRFKIINITIAREETIDCVERIEFT